MSLELRLRGPWWINQSRLDTSVSSQGGEILANGAVVVTLSAYSFFPDREAQMTIPWDLYPMYAGIPPANEAIPQFLIGNNEGSARSYDVQWRHVNP